MKQLFIEAPGGCLQSKNPEIGDFVARVITHAVAD